MNKLVEKYPYLGSSKGDGSLSLTVKGVIVGLIPLAVILLKQIDIEVTPDLLLNVLELGLAMVSAVAIFIGAVRKIVKKV